MKSVTAAEANRQFSRVLREVSQGETFTVVSRGKPVATISASNMATAQRLAAKASLLTRLHTQEATGSRDWSRDELYERGP
jgi:prevent-host-death family protein